jgi:hypothetical protein
LEAFVVVIDGNGQHFFGFVLTDNVLVQKGFDIARGDEVNGATVPAAFVGGLFGSIRLNARFAKFLLDDFLRFFHANFAYLPVHAGHEYHYFFFAAPAEGATVLGGSATLYHVRGVSG